MSIGYPVNKEQVNQQLGSAAIQIRNACRNAENFGQWNNTTGEGGLEELGFSPAEGSLIRANVAALRVISGVFFGTATQATAHNYDYDSAVLYGGN